MEFLGAAVHGIGPSDVLTGLVYGILKILAFSAMGIVIAGMVTSCLCDLFECRKWRQCRGRTETWQLMH
jgi:hypothetical protein